MWIPRLTSLAIMVLSLALGYYCFAYLLEAADGVAVSWPLAGFVGIILGCLGFMLGLGGTILSFNIDCSGNGTFKYKQNEFIETLHPRFRRRCGESYCSASWSIGVKLMVIMANVFLFFFLIYVAYAAVTEHYILVMYVGGGAIGLAALVLLLIWSKTFRIFALCVSVPAFFYGLVLFIRAFGWATPNAWLVQHSHWWLPMIAVLGFAGGLGALCQVFKQTPTYRKVCPINKS